MENVNNTSIEQIHGNIERISGFKVTDINNQFRVKIIITTQNGKKETRLCGMKLLSETIGTYRASIFIQQAMLSGKQTPIYKDRSTKVYVCFYRK